MTKQELWAAYVASNPSFIGDKPITLSPAGLKKLFDQTWGRAYEQGSNDYARTESYEAIPRNAAIFNDIFNPKTK